MVISDHDNAMVGQPVRQPGITVAMFGHAMADHQTTACWIIRFKHRGGNLMVISAVQSLSLFAHGRGMIPLRPGVATPAVSINV